jgi:hypothetical protein
MNTGRMNETEKPGANPVISIFIKWSSGYRTYYTTGIRCAAFDKFTEKSMTANCWSNALEELKWFINSYSLGENVEILPSDITIERIFMDSIEFIEKWDKESKENTNELRTIVGNYVHENVFHLKEPLNFKLTGLDMKLSDANKEVERLRKILYRDVSIEGKKFNSIPDLELFKIQKYLGYDSWQ